MTILRDISTTYASLFSLVLLMLLFESRYSHRKTVWMTLLLMIPLLAINVAMLFVIGPQKMSTLLLLTCSLPSLVFFFLLARYRDGRFFFTFCLADTIVLEIMHATMILDYFLGNQYVFMFAARIILCPVVAWALYKWFRPLYMDLQRKVSNGWFIFSAIALLFYIVLSMFVSVPTMITQRPEQLPIFILLLILMPAVYIHIFSTLRHQQRLYYMAEQQNILKLQASNMAERMEEFSAVDEKLRIERMDFRHKLRDMAELVERGEYEKIKELAREYDDSLQGVEVQRYCSHSFIDAILSAYLHRAERSGIEVSTKLDFPDSLPASEIELVTVFANAIENAINAAGKMPEGKRRIDVDVSSAPVFMIQVCNSFDGEVEFDRNGIPVSYDEDHGFGTRSIVAFCDKYGANYEFKVADGMFLLRISF